MNRDSLVQLPAVLAPIGERARESTSEQSGDLLVATGGQSGDPLVATGGHSGDPLVARFVMGIDGGATQTLARVRRLERRYLPLGHGGPSKQDAVGVHAATNALLEAADQAI